MTVELGISERRACRALGQHRSTQRKKPTTPDDEAALTADIVELARQYGRYGYRRVTALLRRAASAVGSRYVLERLAFALLDNSMPLPKAVRLLGVSLSSLQHHIDGPPQLDLRI